MNIARKQQEPFDVVLTRYALERLLYRLSISPQGDRFVLKGALLFQIWMGQIHRATRDLDLLGHGDPSLQNIERAFQDVCDQAVDDDGIKFLAETILAERLKEDEEYQGLRLKLDARLAAARIRVQIDIGFGDAVTPEPRRITYPTLLEFPAPIMKAYPPETVVAEKFQAIVALGIANSRIKDFYDVWKLARVSAFSGNLLCEAVRATFNRRKTELPTVNPLAFTLEFTQDEQKVTQWNAFVRKNKLNTNGLSLIAIAKDLEAFLMPPTVAIVRGEEFDLNWPQGGPWKQ